MGSFASITELFPEIKKYICYNKINEMRLVCNVFKHGNGGSLTDLRLIRPDMCKRIIDDFGPEIIRPLAGMDVEVSEKDFIEYVKAIKLFFKEAFEEN